MPYQHICWAVGVQNAVCRDDGTDKDPLTLSILRLLPLHLQFLLRLSSLSLLQIVSVLCDLRSSFDHDVE